MKLTVTTALGAVFAGAVLLTANAASAGPAPATPELGCHDLLGPSPGVSSAVGANQVIESAFIASHPDPKHNELGVHANEGSKAHPAEIGYAFYERGGVVEAELALGDSPTNCPGATYALELYDLAKRPVLLDDVRVSGAAADTGGTDEAGNPLPRVLLSALIDDADALYTGEANKTCTQFRLVVRDAAGAVVDVEPNAGLSKVCTGPGTAGSYSG